MLEKITKKQEKKLEVYLNKWLELGRRTKTMDREKAVEAVGFFYSMINIPVPSDVRFVSSPLEANNLINELSGASKNNYTHPTRSIHWISYYAFYDYILNELFPEKKGSFQLFLDFLKHSKEVFSCYMYENIVIICDFPETYNLNDEGKLHGVNKPSLQFRDGFKLFNLNGISVSEEIANLKEKDITKDIILQQQNADVRREIIRKLSAKKLVEVLDAQILDKKTFKVNGESVKYELLNIDINGRGRVRPFLKMINPSLKKVIHVEGVDEKCKTVEDAIKFRNGLDNFELPKALS